MQELCYEIGMDGIIIHSFIYLRQQLAKYARTVNKVTFRPAKKYFNQRKFLHRKINLIFGLLLLYFHILHADNNNNRHDCLTI
jgi:hypothetical protein